MTEREFQSTSADSTSKMSSAINDDLRHLQLLSIFHFVAGGITALFGCFPLIHLTIGILLVRGVIHAQHGQG